MSEGLIHLPGESKRNRLIGIGITLETYSRMLQGEAMTLDMARFGIPGVTLLIVAGKEKAEITRDIQRRIAAGMGIDIPAGLIGQKAGP